MLSVGPTDDVTNQMVRRMKTTLHTTAGLAVGPYTSPARMGRITSPSGQLVRDKPLLRKYEVAHLTPSLHSVEFSKMAPVLPVFENAFGAFGRGAILTTKQGPMAVEDLLPGDEVMTSDHGYQTLLWRGSMVITPSDTSTSRTMTRITADAFGLGRPAHDLVLGPAARMRHTSSAAKTLTGSDSALIPVQDFVDGDQVIALRPIAPVHTYQLGFAAHTCVKVNGIDVETLHPGPAHALGLGHDMLTHFMALFPHMNRPADFGPLIAPRLRKDDLDLVRVA